MKTNTKAEKHSNAMEELERAVLSCFLFENQFYESGNSIAKRIETLCEKVSAKDISCTAVLARNHYHLRHVPLFLVIQALKKKHNVKEIVRAIIKRPDEMAELLALYWKDGKKPLPASMKKGLAEVFQGFSEYQLAKYNRDSKIKLRDVMFLVHPKPLTDHQAEYWKKLANNNLPAPDTWEVALSSGKDKKETFERLIREEKLGGLALLRNLRNMVDANVDINLVKQAILTMNSDRILPFRFFAAAKAAPVFEKELDQKLSECAIELTGKTVILVDVSVSMSSALSSKSDLTYIQAACTLASCIKGNVRVFSFSDYVQEVPHRLGMAGVDTIRRSQLNSGTQLYKAIQATISNVPFDRLIVITDEQATDAKTESLQSEGRKYIINVASYEKGIQESGWIRINGFSEAVFDYIKNYEKRFDLQSL